jgi:hypothetical protein
MSSQEGVTAAGVTPSALEDPVPGSLRRRLRAWRRITNDRWVIKTLKRGLKLDFVSRPSATKFLPNHRMTANESQFVTSELARLLVVGAVSRCSHRPFLCLPLGVVPKKNGKLRLIHDLRFLNSRIQRPPRFKLEDLSTVAEQVKEGDEMMTLDLEQGYYHVEIHEQYRKYFGFEWQGQYYTWNVLPFGLSTAPLVFTKILRPVVQALRRTHGLRVNLYLDDFLLMVGAGQAAVEHRAQLLDLLRKLGLHVNYEKSNLTPSKHIEYLGMEINTDARPTFLVPRSRLKKIRHEISRTLRMNALFPARHLARLAGICVSTLRAILPGRMLLRNVYRQLAGVACLSETIALSQGSREDLEWWLHALSHWNGAAAMPIPADMTLTTDSSDLGWGAVLGDKEARGSWTQFSARCHINARELEAVLLGLQSFKDLLHGKSVLLRSDNVTVVASVNRLYGRSHRLNFLIRQIFDHCQENNITLRAVWIPGVTNKDADRLSRAPDLTDWEVTPLAFSLIDLHFGPHTVDRMASAINTKTERFNSRLYDPQAEAVNCFAQDWSGENNYVAPPFALIPTILRHIQQCKAETTTIVVPMWTSAWWWPRLLRMTTAPPLQLRTAKGVFRAGPSGRVEPFRNDNWTFAAFRISGSKA